MVKVPASTEGDEAPGLPGATTENTGLYVGSSLGEPTAERGGKAKRLFRVTPKGLAHTKDTQQALTALWDNLPQLRAGRA